MDITEEINDRRIRVLKFNRKLLNDRGLESHGLFLFRVTNEINRVYSPTTNGTVKDETTDFTDQNDVLAFTLDRLLSQDSIEALARCAVKSTELFFVETAATLAKDISSYLISNSDQLFTKKTLFGQRKPMMVIVVDVYMLRNIDYTKEGEIREVCRFTDEDLQKEIIDNITPYDDQLIDDADSENEDDDDSMDIDSDDIDVNHVLISRILQGFLDQESNVVDDSMNICPICLDELSEGKEVTAMPCSHLFHSDCIFQWLWNVNSCPICRRPVPFAPS